MSGVVQKVMQEAAQEARREVMQEAVQETARRNVGGVEGEDAGGSSEIRTTGERLHGSISTFVVLGLGVRMGFIEQDEVHNEYICVTLSWF